MKRGVLMVPIEELDSHFQSNERQDVKIVVPGILTEALRTALAARGKKLKSEVPLDKSGLWRGSGGAQPNTVCEAADFGHDSDGDGMGPFAVSFANEKAERDEHYHARHTEIYFSEHRMSGHYRAAGDGDDTAAEAFELRHGGLALFGPGISHLVQLTGLTLILETPAIAAHDRFTPGGVVE